MTISVTTDLTSTPPKNILDLAIPVGGVMSSISVWRNDPSGQTPLRDQPSAGFDSRQVTDFEMPHGVEVTYGWQTQYVDPSGIIQVWSEAWASLSAWTTVGASWSVSSGKLVWTGADSATASVTRAVTSGLYQVKFATPPVGISRLDFGGFYIDVANSRLVVGNNTITFAPGTGAWTIGMTATSTSITTTAGTFSVAAGALMTQVSFIGTLATFTAATPWTLPGNPGQMAIAVAPNGHIYLGILQSPVILIYDATGTQIGSFGSAGTGNGQFGQNITGIAVDSSGNVFVSEGYTANRVQKFTVSGVTVTYAAQVGSTGTGNGQFQGAYSVACDSAGNVYVCDSSGHRVQKFTNSLVYSSKFGTQGATDGKLYIPTSIAVSPAGKIYVGDGTGRVQRFSAAFAWEYTYPQGKGVGQLYAPGMLAVDGDNVLHVPSSDYRIARFTAAGVALPQIVVASNSPDGDFRSIAVAPNGTVYLPDGIYTNGQTPRMLSYTRSSPSVSTTTLSSYTGIILVNETSDPITVDPPDGWMIHPIIPALSCRLILTDPTKLSIRGVGDIENDSNATLHYILGSDKPIPTINGPRYSDSFELVLELDSAAEEAAVKALLNDQTPVLFNLSPALGIGLDYGFYQVGKTSRSRLAQMPDAPWKTYVLPLTQVQSPIASVQNSGWSWAALALEFPTWDAVKAAFATWADVAANKRRPGF